MRRIDLDMRVAELAASQYALVSHSQARQIGLSSKATRGRIASGDWIPVYARVFRIAAAPQTWDQALMAALLAAGERSAISAEPAAAFWKVPGFAPGGVRVSLPVGRLTRALRGQLQHTCYLPAHHISTIRGIRVTTPARTIFDPGRCIADMKRDAKLTALGLSLIRVTARRLRREPDEIAAEIRAILRAADAA